MIKNVERITINQKNWDTLNMDLFTKTDFKCTCLPNHVRGQLSHYDFTHETWGKIITHSGAFHADEIFAIAAIFIARIAMWNTKHPENQLRLTEQMIRNSVERKARLDVNSEVDEMNCYQGALALDIKDGHWDHHRRDNEVLHLGETDLFYEGANPNQQMAAMGCTWRAIGKLFNIETEDPELKDMVYQKVYRNFLQDIDLQDTLGPKAYRSPISFMISNMNAYTELERNIVQSGEKKDLPDNFVEAILLGYSILRAEIFRVQNIVRGAITAKDVCEFVDNGTHCYVRIPKVSEGQDEPMINLESLEMIDINGKTPQFLVNENPDKREGAVRLIMVDSSKACIKEKYLDEPVEGKLFLHPARFLMTFKDVESLNKFLENDILEYPQGSTGMMMV